jgi:hypothetical protein
MLVGLICTQEWLEQHMMGEVIADGKVCQSTLLHGKSFVRGLWIMDTARNAVRWTGLIPRMGMVLRIVSG